MDLLEHPLEAVAFRLYSLPIPDAASAATGAAAWTCLAALLAAAAAAGLWRLRSSTLSAVVAVSTKPLELDPSPVAVSVSPPPEPSRPSSQRPPDPAAASTTPTTPKERYTAYYRDAGCVGCCDVGSDEDGDENEEEDGDFVEEHEDGDRDVFVADGADPFGWGEVVRPLRPLGPTTAAEMGRRYRRSPTAALRGGSVVQLWGHQGAGAGGGLTTPTASPWRRGRVVLGGAVSAF